MFASHIIPFSSPLRSPPFSLLQTWFVVLTAAAYLSFFQHSFTKLAIQAEIQRLTKTLPVVEYDEHNDESVNRVVDLDSKENEEERSECYTTNDTCNDTYGGKQQEILNSDAIVGNVRMESPGTITKLSVENRGADMLDEQEPPSLVSA